MMKHKIFRLLLSAISIPIMFMACSKDDEETSPSSNNNSNQNQEDQMVFKVNGNQKNFSDIVVYASLGNQVSLEAWEDYSYPREELIISFPDTTSTGNYQITSSSFIEASFSRIDSVNFGTIYGDEYIAINGSLNLDQINDTDQEARGSFSFTAVNTDDNQDTLRITDGSFNFVND